jgi:hypothetical protein
MPAEDSVLVPYFSDEIYHSAPPTCHFMTSGADEMPQALAERKGYRPCRRCFDAE